MNLKDDLLKGACAHSFVWRNEVYFLHATYRDPERLIKRHGTVHMDNWTNPADKLWACLRKDPEVPNVPIIAAVISRVFDDPLIAAEIAPGHEASAEAQQELKEFHDQMVELNGVNFWRMYYEQMEFKTFVDKMVENLTDGQETPDSLPLEKFLSIATTGYFLHCIHGKLMEDKIGMMESSPFDYSFMLYGDPPKERDDVAYFFMWRLEKK